ncbi:G-protein coupled receptor 84-like [Diadema antillarum]|uniref:G-protein coupled receptor 84-like n=1 Tax=Diadema antillarum TaxID=105358 RepID=UPI003A89990D
MASLLVTVIISVAVPCVLAGVICNAAVALCILLTSSLRSRTNVFIVSLAVSGVLLLTTVVPFQMDSYLTNEWRYSEMYCHVTARLSFICVGVTTNNIAMLGLYRYFCVVHRHNVYLRSRKSVALMILCAWTIPVGLEILKSGMGWTKTRFIPSYGRCIVEQGSSVAKVTYNASVLGGLLITLLIAVYSYARIICTVVTSSRKIQTEHAQSGASAATRTLPNSMAGEHLSTYAEPTSAYSEFSHRDRETLVDKTDESIMAQTTSTSRSNSSNDTQQRKSRARRKAKQVGISRQEVLLSKICALMFFVFFVCYGPIFILTIAFADTLFPPEAYTACTVIYWLGSCINPILYASLQTDMRKKLVEFLGLSRCLSLGQIHSVDV